MKQRTICKTLAVAVILLFLGLAIQPSVAVTQKEAITVSTLNPDKTRYLANFSMDFGENITNDRIEYESIRKRPEGDYTINVKVNFNCPDNLMIVVKYEYYAEAQEFITSDRIFFCDAKKLVTIINGSNPPDRDIDYTKFCPNQAQHDWLLTLRIKANLTAYEYVDGEWVKHHNNDTFKEIKDVIIFNRVRPSERTKTSNDDCGCHEVNTFESKYLFNRLEGFINIIQSRFGHIPEIKSICKEILDVISIGIKDTICELLLNPLWRLWKVSIYLYQCCYFTFMESIYGFTFLITFFLWGMILTLLYCDNWDPPSTNLLYDFGMRI